jgi:hypothetical protein
MSLIFKEQYYSDKERNKIKFDDSLEFCIALLEKCNGYIDAGYSIYKIKPVDEEKSFYVLKKKIDSNIYFNIEGVINHSKLEICEKVSGFHVNMLKLQKYQELLLDFNALEYQKDIQDKFGEVYNLKYYSNYSAHQSGYSREDIILVSNVNNEKVGYLKLIYRKKQDHDLLEPSFLNKFLCDNDLDYGINRNTKKEELLNRAEIYLKSIEYSSNNINVQIKEAEKYLRSRFPSIESETYDIGTVFYSHVEEDYTRRGLATQMYIEAAKMFTNRGVTLRASTSQTDAAKGLWSSLEKSNMGNVSKVNIDGNELLTLSVKEDIGINNICDDAVEFLKIKKSNTTIESIKEEFNSGAIFYHGNENPIHRFSEVMPSFFSSDKEYSMGYGDYVHSYQIDIKKPFDTATDEVALNYYNTVFLSHELGKEAKKIKKGQHISANDADNFWAFLSVEEMIGNGFGYDSIIVDEGLHGRFKTNLSIVPFKNSQITPTQDTLKAIEAHKKGFDTKTVWYHVSNIDFDNFDLDKTFDGCMWLTRNYESILNGETGASISSGNTFIHKFYVKEKKFGSWDENENYFNEQLIRDGYNGVLLDDDLKIFNPSDVFKISSSNPNQSAKLSSTKKKNPFRG